MRPSSPRPAPAAGPARPRSPPCWLARPRDHARTYEYLIGTGLLCDLDPSACPDVAMAPNGDTVEITGSGTFTIHPDSVTGGGAAPWRA